MGDRLILGGLWDSRINQLLEFQANDIFCLKIVKRWMWMVPEVRSTQRFMHTHICTYNYLDKKIVLNTAMGFIFLLSCLICTCLLYLGVYF